jgi:hypothetical protein
MLPVVVVAQMQLGPTVAILRPAAAVTAVTVLNHQLTGRLPTVVAVVVVVLIIETHQPLGLVAAV